MATSQLQTQKVALGWLAELKLPSKMERVWTGSHILRTLDGKRWQPVGRWGKIGTLESRTATVSASFTLELTRPHDTASNFPVNNEKTFEAAVRKDWHSDIRGGRATIYAQVFNATTFKPVKTPIAIATGRMSPLRYEASTDRAIVSVEVSGILADGSKPPNGYCTDEDQQTRYAGDRIFEFVPQLKNRTLRWPKTN